MAGPWKSRELRGEQLIEIWETWLSAGMTPEELAQVCVDVSQQATVQPEEMAQVVKARFSRWAVKHPPADAVLALWCRWIRTPDDLAPFRGYLRRLAQLSVAAHVLRSGGAAR